MECLWVHIDLPSYYRETTRGSDEISQKDEGGLLVAIDEFTNSIIK